MGTTAIRDGEGWIDLAVTLADAGLPAPPVPDEHRYSVRTLDDWFWSTRSDIGLGTMYAFYPAIDEAMERGDLADYFALAHCAIGMNNVCLNLFCLTGLLVCSLSTVGAVSTWIPSKPQSPLRARTRS